VLVSHGRLSEEARARLDALVATDDGFRIAEKDLEIRGPGDFFGTRQWGLAGFRVSHLLRDRDLLERARNEAFRCVGEPAPLRLARDFRARGGARPRLSAGDPASALKRTPGSSAQGGRRLESVKGQATRPTASRVRQTLFDILAPRIPGSRFLDAFAGSGGVGLEALSRGAARVVFVEHAADAVAVLKRNVARLGSAASAEVHRQDALVALAALADAGRRFDIIYVDPPTVLYEASWKGRAWRFC
jgi:hypothetical protein